VNTQLTRRQLLVLIGMSAAPGCRARDGESRPERQQATEQTVTLIVDGMI
jgi:hypothetical protein